MLLYGEQGFDLLCIFSLSPMSVVDSSFQLESRKKTIYNSRATQRHFVSLPLALPLSGM